MRIKTLVLSLVILALTIVTSMTTLAYFTDSDSVTNTFSVGSVAIKSAVINDGNVANAKCTGMEDGSVCQKYISVLNYGTSSIYARVRILIPKSLLSGNAPAITIATDPVSQTTTATDVFVETDKTIGSEAYTEYSYIWGNSVSAATISSNETVPSSTSSVTFTITSNQVITGSTQGENSSTTDTAFADLGIIIKTEGIQAQGFSTASAAFNVYDNNN